MKRALIAVLAIGTAMTVSNCKKDEPTADFTFSVDGMTVNFSYTGENGDDFTWSFGDGGTSSSENPEHTYSEGGTYSVTLSVSNDDGSDSQTQSVTIEEEEVMEPEGGSPELNFGDADGACYSINTVTIQEVAGFEVEINLGTAVAWFANEDGDAFVDVGNVSFVQDALSGTLEIQDNNSYNWLEDATTGSEGFGKSGGVEYSIEGGNGHPSINGLSNGFPFPTVKKIDETSSTVDAGSSYTLSHDGSINNADSIIYSIYGVDNSITETVSGTTTSVTFSADDMSSLGDGAALLQIAGYKITSQTLGDKKYYMVNETVATKSVTIE